MIEKEPDAISIVDDLTELALEEPQKRIDDILAKGGKYDPETRTYRLHDKLFDEDGYPLCVDFGINGVSYADKGTRHSRPLQNRHPVA